MRYANNIDFKVSLTVVFGYKAHSAIRRNPLSLPFERLPRSVEGQRSCNKWDALLQSQ